MPMSLSAVRTVLRRAGWALACTGLLAAAPARADQVLRVSLNTELQVLDPIPVIINATRVFAYMAFDTLIGIDNEGRYHPQMLDGWTVSDDRLTYTFRLRDGLVFSDGSPVTAEDCVASIRRWAKREGFGQQLMAATAEMAVVDAKTFTIRLNRPFAFVIDALGKPGNVIPVIMPARLAAMDPNRPVPEVIGSGPFLFRKEDWKPGARAVLDRNPAYKPRPEPADGLAGGKVVKVDRVEILSVPESATRVAALQQGELDWLEIVPFDFIDVLRKDPNITIPSQRGVDQIMSIVTLNNLTPPFNNPKIRRAAQMAINQEDVMRALGLPDGMYQKSCLSIYMCDAAGTTDAGTEAYAKTGPEAARALLREAGYHNEPVVLLHAASSAVLDPIGMVVADQLQKAGFNVQVQTTDFATIAQKRQQKMPVDQGGWSAIPIIYNGIDLINPLADPTVSNNCNQFYPGWYCDPALTELLHRFSEAVSETDRKALMAAIQAAFHRNVNMVIGGQFSAPPAYRSNLHGVIPFGFPVFWNIERR
jgi:peptide/nickel transport system substrate-binding protein